MTLGGIIDKIKAGRYCFFDHAVKRISKRSISRKEEEEKI
jgi:hypothetical protein